MLGTSSAGRFCIVRLDRVLAIAQAASDGLPIIHGFQTISDCILRSQGYGRVRNLENLQTGTKLGVAYAPLRNWLPEIKLTITPKKKSELHRAELLEILSAFPESRLLQAELAFDFGLPSIVNRGFVEAHAKFGKCRPIAGSSYETRRYGRRKSGAFIRAYLKPEMNAYRVELQFNSTWLRLHNIGQPPDLCQLAILVCPACFAFVEFDWKRLGSYLRRHRGAHAAEILTNVHRRSHTLHLAIRYLRLVGGLENTHRFLRRLAINRNVKGSLRRWSRRWGCCDAF